MMVQQLEGINRIEILSSFTQEVKIVTMQNTYVIFQLDVTEEHAKFCLLTSPSFVICFNWYLLSIWSKSSTDLGTGIQHCNKVDKNYRSHIVYSLVMGLHSGVQDKLYMHVCTSVCIPVCTNIYVYMYMYICSVYIYMYMYICSI